MNEKPLEEQANVQALITLQAGADRRRYNLPTVEEVAAIIPGHSSEDVQQHRDIVLRLKGGGLQRISHLHPLYSPLHYVLLFPHGDQGWHKDMTLPNGRRLTQRLYYAYCLFPRPDRPLSLFYFGRLFQQYVVDAWASIEESELFWVRSNQTKIRADLYQGLKDAVEDSFGSDNEVDLAQRGLRIVLPSSHTSSPRHMFQLYQNSMAICRWAGGHPDIFATMTANPNWPEIQEALLEYQADDSGDPDRPSKHQTAADRPDIVARVFKIKLDAFINDLTKHFHLGQVSASVYTIEYQKRGLPHAHILLFFHPDAKIRDAAHVDSIVSAQIPDAEAFPHLHKVVTTCMMHGPCGPEYPNAPCMVDGKCSKKFPRDFTEETIFGENGYPLYARPDNGRTYTNSKGVVFDNRHVVPYNAYFSAKFCCHINMEVCVSIKSVKYVTKYIYKGPDLATVDVGGNRDEIKQYVDGRYIGPVEACWRIMEFTMHRELPSVYRLPVHLEGQHLVFFNPDDVPEDVVQRPNSQVTQLTQWFAANNTYPAANQHTYQDFPQHFVYNSSQKKWTPRKQNFAIGRMAFVHPSAGERFYLRMLLTIVKGAKSWAGLRTIDNIPHPTYKAACLALGLLEDDGEWDQCLNEAGQIQLGGQLRQLFAIILLNCQPAMPLILWDNHKANICDDLAHRLSVIGYADPSEDQVFDYGLHLIDKILSQSGRSLQDFPPMPLPQQQWALISNNSLLQEQLDYDLEELAVQVEEKKILFNVEQRAVFDAVVDSVRNQQGKVFFLHSAGGCGKTFVCNIIAAAVRSSGKVALCVASSGIASLLLDGGSTAHSRFKIPIPILDNSSCAVKKGSILHGLFKETGIIIWDEAPMQHKFAIEAVDKCLRDLLDKDILFGGITVLFGGDFRQVCTL
jgi:hypothetical protein